MEEKTKMSIIIPVCNAERYLEQCLESAISQTIEPKEIICIDDGSTDGTGVILEKYAADYSFIHCYAQDNQGAGSARNHGMKKAVGEFIAFLDADDFYIDPEALERMYYSCKTQLIPICGSFRKILVENRYIDFELHRDICDPDTEGIMVLFTDYQDDLHYQNYIYQKELLDCNDIIFPLYRRYQDPPFFLKAMTAAGKFWVCPTELYCLRLGHQNFKQYEKMADQTLLGIRDNMRLASKYNYTVLQKRLIERIETEYFSGIMQNMNRGTVKLLVDIYENASEAGKDMGIFQKAGSCFLSHRLYERLLWMKQKRGTLAGCLTEKGIYNIALYGLGTFGEVMYQEFVDTEVKILYGIDRNKKEFHDLYVYSPDDILPECDAVLITPVNAGSIKEELSKITKLPLIVLEDFVLETAEQIRRESERNV